MGWGVPPPAEGGPPGQPAEPQPDGDPSGEGALVAYHRLDPPPGSCGHAVGVGGVIGDAGIVLGLDLGIALQGFLVVGNALGIDALDDLDQPFDVLPPGWGGG